MTFLAPSDGPDVAYEFFAPFVHIPGKYEWCRIRSPTHGVFDTMIVLGASTEVAADVYVNASMGERFMQERYPECRTHRVSPGGLRITEDDDGRTVSGHLQASEGPLRMAELVFRAAPAAMPQQVPYGGTGGPVWGSRFTCWGVDLNLTAAATGRITEADGKERVLRGVPAIVTLGSFGRIAPRTVQPPAARPATP